MKRSDSELAFQKYLNFNLLDDNESDSKHHEFDHEEVKEFTAVDGLDAETVLTPMTPNYQSSYNIGPTSLDSQSSCMCGSGSAGCAKGSCCSGSEESSDVEEAGWCEQSNGNDPVALKRMRRKVSNRESARRSRRRKQAHLADLEMQVEQMRGEHGCLYRRLGELGEEYQQADRCHQLLKSKVIALRAHLLKFAHHNIIIPPPITNSSASQTQNLAGLAVAVAPSITLISSPTYLNNNNNNNTNNYLPLPSNTLPTSHLPL